MLPGSARLRATGLYIQGVTKTPESPAMMMMMMTMMMSD